MSFRWPKPGPMHAPEYQLSSIPFVTSSTNNEVKGHAMGLAQSAVRVAFPFVTRWFAVRCSDGTRPLRVGFTAASVVGTGSYFVLPRDAGSGQDTPIVFDLAVKELFFSSDNHTFASDFSLIAGLTNIPSKFFPTLTASNGHEGVG